MPKVRDLFEFARRHSQFAGRDLGSTREQMVATETQLQPVMPWIRANRALLAMLAMSLLLHALATVGTPVWLHTGQERTASQFDAVLTPIPVADPVENPLKLKPLPLQPAPNFVARNAPRKSSAPRSEATFAAPENAIAVERPSPTVEGDPTSAVIETDAAAAKVSDQAKSGLADAGVAPQSPPDIVEKPLPIRQPFQAPDPATAVELPSRVSIAYSATSSIADGVARYTWTRDAEKYTFESTIQASGFFAEMFAGTLTQQSIGTVTTAGIAPTLFSIRRGDRAPETAEFQRATNEVKLSRGGESRQVAMPANLQDTQSFLFQLAIEAPKLKSPEDRVTIFVTNGRGINRYTFKKVGESPVVTRFGVVETVHLAREISDPSDGYEVWVSPKHNYLPIKLKFFMGRFPAELIATTITSTP